MPDHIGDIGRSVIKGRHSKAGLMCRGNKCVTRTNARADYSKFAVALLLKPIDTRADDDHTLTYRIEGPANLGGSEIVCPSHPPSPPQIPLPPPHPHSTHAH